MEKELIRMKCVEGNRGYEETYEFLSFLAVQVIFICVYITNYLHFFTVFLSF